MKSRAEQAVECFKDGFNCAQAVFTAFTEESGITRNEALKISCGFGAGMGRRQETCGAVSGAILAIGARHGKTDRADDAATETTYRLVREASMQFAARHGTTQCKGLIGCDLQQEEGRKIFKEKNMKESRCTKYVHDAAEIAEALLAKE